MLLRWIISIELADKIKAAIIKYTMTSLNELLLEPLVSLEYERRVNARIEFITRPLIEHPVFREVMKVLLIAPDNP